MAKPKSKTSVKKKNKKNIPKGIAHIHATFNNTIVSISDEFGNVLSWASAGTLGFKGSKKSTPYAAQMIAEAAGRGAIENGVKTIQVEVKGPGPGRDAAVRSLQGVGLQIVAISDKTPIPHNGVRPRKRPRG